MNLKNIENKKRFLGIYEKAINNKFSWEEKIYIAKKAGYDFIEFSVDETEEKLKRLNWSDKKINNLRKLLYENDFYLNSMTLSGHRKYPFGSKDPKIRKKAFIIMEKAIILAKKLGIRIVQIATYDEYYNPEDEITKQNFISGMKRACQLAQKHSVTLAFETMDTSFGGTISKCLNFVNQINSPYLYIYPDIGNLTQFTNDIENEMELGKNKIVAFHFKDTTSTKFKEVPFGQGSVDFPRLLKSIDKNELNCPIMIEMWSKNKKEETIEQNINFIKEAKEFYEKQWELVNKNE